MSLEKLTQSCNNYHNIDTEIFSLPKCPLVSNAFPLPYLILGSDFYSVTQLVLSSKSYKKRMYNATIIDLFGIMYLKIIPSYFIFIDMSLHCLER